MAYAARAKLGKMKRAYADALMVLKERGLIEEEEEEEEEVEGEGEGGDGDAIRDEDEEQDRGRIEQRGARRQAGVGAGTGAGREPLSLREGLASSGSGGSMLEY